jgi:hypothetical protein
LIQEGFIEKLGRSPRVFYRIKQTSAIQYSKSISIPEVDLIFLKNHFLIITELGERKEGIEAMKVWCQRQKLPLEKTIHEFIITRKKYLEYFQSNGLIDGMDKFKNTKAFEILGLSGVYYCDFYAIERFGKTKLGTLLHFAKQGQNRQLMYEIIDVVKPKLKILIEELDIDVVGFIPPTIRRQLQFMKVLQQGLKINLPTLNLIKVSGQIPIPQKALSNIQDRMSNARSSIMVGESKKYSRALLIDDAIGSGATMNETALKLKQRDLVSEIYGLAITGSYKGFEVIQEV